MNDRTPGVGKLTVTEIGVEKLTPNPWNPNRMSDAMQAKLKAYIEREGLVEPLVVRAKGDLYEILGGYHRWGIAKELGYETVPCVLVNLDDQRSKILSVNLNELKGQSLPDLLGNLIHDLSKELTLDDLASQLPYSQEELQDALELLKIPDGLEAFLDDAVAKQATERPTVLTFVVDKAETVEAAIDVARERHGRGSTRGGALLDICTAYLAGVGNDEKP